ncbi:MAG: AbrB/MazE/SpoVT family DNA-binding domain-containing protein [Gammaproteobacteria bacterium]|nr:MAG: AbrB/MazE/SpoVT family DNA-binding domain-containing protein [Gammaproteobacteria bacterium]
MSQLAKLSPKGQITVPAEVRKRLQLKAGDTLAWEVLENGKISVHRVEESLDVSYLAALNDVLSEWNSTEDDEAYRNL